MGSISDEKHNVVLDTLARICLDGKLPVFGFDLDVKRFQGKYYASAEHYGKPTKWDLVDISPDAGFPVFANHFRVKPAGRGKMVKILIWVADTKPLYLNADEYVDKINYRKDGKHRALPVNMLFGSLVTAILVACLQMPSFDRAMQDLKIADEARPGTSISTPGKRMRRKK